ncbi:ABC transporter ATP-binding protein [Corynebacterium pseudodiphtheriticum]|uniref:ABC transporter ATP-binding protein n=1 Tax=Corynebacterium pseudodiphtheriticum TaxID=37637 RepID=UPI0020BE50D2|nr:ABC transporter ATP-binding protein [Corynebacterium pseudodiphtheriticum]UQV58856.1 ABC transporter ATP-binding protein [Corynebacterium pseudodiphtheriticum]
MGSRLEVKELSAGYGDDKVLDGLDLAIVDNAVTAVVGPNGCGKSTLVKALGRILEPKEGGVYLDGRSLQSINTKAIARTVSILPQNPQAPVGITVKKLVSRGRFPHQKWWGANTEHDAQVIREALRTMRLEKLADEPVANLSGGQRQRVWIAMSLAQEADILLLDEPTNHLDLIHQLEIMELLRSLPADHRTVVVVLHDLALAARYSDYLVAMRDGVIVSQGRTEDTFNEQLLLDTFSLESKIYQDESTGLPVVLPLAAKLE